MAITNKQREAASLIADDRLPDTRIAERVGVHRDTLRNWRNKPEFAELVNEYKLEHDRSMRRLLVARRRDRMKVLDDQLAALLAIRDARVARYAPIPVAEGVELLTPEVVAERAAREARRQFVLGEPEPPGMETGYLVPSWTVVGTGKSQRIVETWKLDTALAGEIRATLEHAAREMGQLPAGHEGDGAGPVRRYIGVAVEDV